MNGKINSFNNETVRKMIARAKTGIEPGTEYSRYKLYSSSSLEAAAETTAKVATTRKKKILDLLQVDQGYTDYFQNEFMKCSVGSF